MSGESWRDRLSALSRGELMALAAVALVALGGAALWYSRSLPRPVQVSARAAVPRPAPSAAASPTPAPLIVHVAGMVRRPGVYEFNEGQRIIDAIEAAGGFRGKADRDALNLAAPLTDGAQVLVPAAAGTGGAVGVGPPAAPGAAGGLVNVNTADATALEALPGIGEVIAQRIVDYRTQNGPFATIDQLEDVSGIGPSILAEIRDLVTV